MTEDVKKVFMQMAAEEVRAYENSVHSENSEIDLYLFGRVEAIKKFAIAFGLYGEFLKLYRNCQWDEEGKLE